MGRRCDGSRVRYGGPTVRCDGPTVRAMDQRSDRTAGRSTPRTGPSHPRTGPSRTVAPSSRVMSNYLADPNTNPIDRSIGLYDVPKSGAVTLFWMSRPANEPKTLYIFRPARKRYLRNCHGRES